MQQLEPAAPLQPQQQQLQQLQQQQQNIVPFSVLLKFQLDSLYNEIQNFAESSRSRKGTAAGATTSHTNGNGKGDESQKTILLELLMNFRSRLMKLLVLYRIPSTDAITKVHSIIDTQDFFIESAANELFQIHSQLKTQQIPTLDVLTAIDVLGTGNYRRLPLVLNNRFIPPNPPSPEAKAKTLASLERMIKVRLLCDEILPLQFQRSYQISDGCVKFIVESEFSITLTLFLGPTSNFWKAMNLEFFCCSGAQIGDYDKIPEIPPERVGILLHEIQTKDLNESVNNNTLFEVYTALHSISVQYILRAFLSQATQLSNGRWSNLRVLKFEMTEGTLQFWVNPNLKREPFQLFISFTPEEPPTSSVTDHIVEEHFNNRKREQMPLGLKLQVSGPFENKFSTLDTVDMSQLDIEKVLDQVTAQISNNITQWWRNELESSGFLIKESNFGEFVQSLQVQVAENQWATLAINPRTGFVNLSLMDGFEPDESTMIGRAFKTIEKELNNDYTVVVKLMGTLVQMTTALQLGFILADDQAIWIENNLLQGLGGYNIFLKTACLDTTQLCISMDTKDLGQGGGQRRTCRVFLLAFDVAGPAITQLLPIDVQPSLQGARRNVWTDLTNMDLIDIHGFAFRYSIFSSLCRELASPAVSFTYVISSGIDASHLSNNLVLAQNLPLCIRFLLDDARSPMENVYNTQKFYSTAVFLRVVYDILSIDLNSKPPVQFTAQIRIPETVAHHIGSEFSRDRIIHSSDNHSFSLLYVDSSEFRSCFLEDSILTLQTIQLGLELSRKEDSLGAAGITWEIVAYDKLRVAISDSTFIDITCEKGSFDQPVNLHLTSDSTVITDLLQHQNLAKIGKGASMASLLLNTSTIYNFVQPLQLFAESAKGYFGYNVHVIIVNFYHVFVGFDIAGLSYGLDFIFTDRTILMQLSLSKDNVMIGYFDYTDPKKTFIGLLSHLRKVFPKSIAAANRICLRADSSSSLSTIIQTYLDMCLSYHKLNEWLLEKSSSYPRSEGKIEPEKFRITRSIAEGVSFLFFGSLDKGWEMRIFRPSDTNGKDFFTISNMILAKAHSTLEPRFRISSEWCKNLVLIASLPENIWADLIKLNKSVLQKNEDKSKTFNVDLLLRVPPNGRDYSLEPGTVAFSIEDGFFRLLLKFYDESDSLLLPLKFDLKDSSLSWWEVNPLGPGLLKMFETNVLKGSKGSQFPGLTTAILSMQSKTSLSAFKKDDQVFSLRDENLTLKKKIHNSEDNTKKLLFKIQKLSEQVTRTGGGVKTKNDREGEEMAAELRNHVQTLNHNNTQLKTKLYYFKTLYETESKKRTPYMHIPPRVETGATRKNIQSGGGGGPSHRSGVGRYSSSSHGGTSMDVEEFKRQQESIAEMQEINAQYRAKLSNQDENINNLERENEHLKEIHDQHQKNMDIDRTALQHELSELKRRLIDQRTKSDNTEDQFRTLGKSYREICVTVEALGKDLTMERKKNSDLEKELQSERGRREGEAELSIIIKDIQDEKLLLEKELARMVESRFATQRDEELQKDLESLTEAVRKLEAQRKLDLAEIDKLKQELIDISVMHANAKNSSQNFEAKSLELQHKLEILDSQMNANDKERKKGPSLADMEEALALLRLKREAGLNFEFLSNWQQLERDNRAVHELRQQYADCVQELEKTLLMLNLEHKINEDCKVEIQQLKNKMRSMQNEYELRLEEYARLNDIRRHKIESLEQHIRGIGVVEARTAAIVTSNLKPGENVLQISIHGAVFSEIGIDFLSKIAPENFNPGSFASFVCLDFFDFQTEVSSLGIGIKPLYNHIAKFGVIVDDFLLHYLQFARVNFQVYLSNGIEFYPAGICSLNLSQLISNESKPFKYLGEIYSSNSKEILGTLEYTIQVDMPIPLAIKAFKERTFALNLTNNNQSIAAPQQTGLVNSLHIEISGASFDRHLPFGKPPTIVGIVQLEPANHPLITDVCKATYSPQFNFKALIPLRMTPDLDRHLRTSKMVIVFADDCEKDWIYGYCKIGLETLVHGNELAGTFDVETATGSACGSLSLKLWWEEPYHVSGQITEIISIQDDPKIRSEMRGDQPNNPLNQPSSLIVDQPVLIPSTLIPEHSTSMVVEVPLPQASVKETADIAADDNKKSESHLTISVTSLHFDFQDQAVKEALAHSQQLFIGIEMFGLPGEQLESESLIIPESGLMEISFTKTFTFEEVMNITSNTRKQILENQVGEEIILSIVDEPHPDAIDQDCVDIGFGVIAVPLISEGLPTKVPLKARSSLLQLGILTISVTGLSAFYKSLE